MSTLTRAQTSPLNVIHRNYQLSCTIFEKIMFFLRNSSSIKQTSLNLQQNRECLEETEGIPCFAVKIGKKACCINQHSHNLHGTMQKGMDENRVWFSPWNDGSSNSPYWKKYCLSFFQNNLQPVAVGHTGHKHILPVRKREREVLIYIGC